MQGIQSGQLGLFGIIVIGVILVSFIASYCILHFGYTITEEEQKQIVAELTKRHEEHAKQEEAAELEVKEAN